MCVGEDITTRAILFGFRFTPGPLRQMLPKTVYNAKQSSNPFVLWLTGTHQINFSSPQGKGNQEGSISGRGRTPYLHKGFTLELLLGVSTRDRSVTTQIKLQHLGKGGGENT